MTTPVATPTMPAPGYGPAQAARTLEAFELHLKAHRAGMGQLVPSVRGDVQRSCDGLAHALAHDPYAVTGTAAARLAQLRELVTTKDALTRDDVAQALDLTRRALTVAAELAGRSRRREAGR